MPRSVRADTILRRLEDWYEDLTSGEYIQAHSAYFIYVNGKKRHCCLAVPNQARGLSEYGAEFAAVNWLLGGPGKNTRDTQEGLISNVFVRLNDAHNMTFFEIADIILETGINPLRKILGMEPYDEGELV